MRINLGTLDSFKPAATFAIDLNSLIFGYTIKANFSQWYELKNFIVSSVIMTESHSLTF